MREQNLGKTLVETQTTGAGAMQPLSERPPVVRIFLEVPLVGNLIANDRSVEILVPEFVLKSDCRSSFRVVRFCSRLNLEKGMGHRSFQRCLRHAFRG